MRESVAAPVLQDAVGANAPWLLEVHDSVGSTNAVALADPRPWRVVVADHQSAGRGRLRRRWEAPPCSSVAVSVVLPVEQPGSPLGWLPLLTGMAMRQAVAALTSAATSQEPREGSAATSQEPQEGSAATSQEPREGSAARFGDRVGLKWPNDVLAREEPGVAKSRGSLETPEVRGRGGAAGWRKLAGVLCELAPSGRAVVCGVGLNIDQSREELPLATATSLALCGLRDVRREQLLAAFLADLLDRHTEWNSGAQGLARVRSAYRRSCLTLGQQVRIHRPDGQVVTGRALEVDGQGRLVLDAPGGRQVHAAGDVEHVRPGQVEEQVGERGAGEPRETAALKDALEARLLGSERSMRPREVSERAQVSLRSARQFWHALGFPNVRDRDRVFTETDLAALRQVAGMVRDGQVEESTALGLVRAMGRTVDRLAVWQTQLAEEARGSRGGRPPTPAQTADFVADLADRLEPLLVYAWRRHLSASLSRLLADGGPVEKGVGVVRAVGFADMVSFTALVRGLTEAELGRMVQQFEVLASDTVTARGGRVIKTLGDEILFAAVDMGAAATIATALVDAVERDPILPRVRVGMACGPVVLRLGDVFGTTVNRASRLTAVARPGTVVVDERVAAALRTSPAFRLSQLPARALEGLGEVSSWALRRAGSAPAGDGGDESDESDVESDDGSEEHDG